MYLPRHNQSLTKKNRLLLAAFWLLLFPLACFAQTDQEKQLFQFVNSERSREKLSPLIWDDQLYRVALAHSKDMARTGNASHRGSDRREAHDRIRDAKIYAAKAGENIARDVNVISAHTLLMQSVDHRANILEPQYTHGAVAVVREKQFFYITQLFIHKIEEFGIEQGRDAIVRELNAYRSNRKFGPLALSLSMSQAAQAHVETQEKLNAMTPMLTMSPIARINQSSTLVSIYTTTNLMEIPDPVQKDLEHGFQKVGIGFKRVRGDICGGSCYLIVLVLG